MKGVINRVFVFDVAQGFSKTRRNQVLLMVAKIGLRAWCLIDDGYNSTKFNMVWVDVVVVKYLSFEIVSYVMLRNNQSCFLFLVFLSIVIVRKLLFNLWLNPCVSEKLEL